MRKFKKAHRLPHDWATLALQLHKFNRSDTNPEKSNYGQQALDQLSYLISEYGDELREAIAVVSQAEGDVNTSRSQQIGQYHRNRIGKLEKSIAQIDDELSEGPPDTLRLAELSSSRKDLEHQLEDHSNKIDKRSHGVHLSKMRRRR